MGMGVAERLPLRHHRQVRMLRLWRGEDWQESAPHHEERQEAHLPTLPPTRRGDQAPRRRIGERRRRALPHPALGRFGQDQLAHMARPPSHRYLSYHHGSQASQGHGRKTLQFSHRSNRPQTPGRADNRQHPNIRTDPENHRPCQQQRRSEGCHRGRQAHHHHHDTEVSEYLRHHQGRERPQLRYHHR